MMRTMTARCSRCHATKDLGQCVRVPRDRDAVTRWDGLPDVATVTVCLECVEPTDTAQWSNCD